MAFSWSRRPEGVSHAKPKEVPPHLEQLEDRLVAYAIDLGRGPTFLVGKVSPGILSIHPEWGSLDTMPFSGMKPA